MESPKPKGGRPRISDRAALGGIVFVLRTGCPWRLLPKDLGYGSGATCWRRLRDWQAAGVWARLHETLLNWLGDEAVIDWSRASLDSLSVRAKRGASKQDRTPLTAANPAPSTTLWWIATASRWPSASRRPTPTMRRSCSRWWIPSRPSSVRVGDRGDRANDRPNSTPTRPTTPRTCGVRCALAALPHESPGEASTPASGWAAIDGWWSACSRGCSAVAASVSATNDGPTCSRGCCTWPVPCSVSGTSPRVDPPPREEQRVLASSGLPSHEHHRRVLSHASVLIPPQPGLKTATVCQSPLAKMGLLALSS
jgi:transposase